MSKILIRKILLIILGVLLLSGCSSEKELDPIDEKPHKSSAQEVDPVEIETNEESQNSAAKEQNKGLYRLRTDKSEEYRDVDLKLGDEIEPLNRVGYTFKGYQDDNKVRYIDETGKLILEYVGTDNYVTLWPIFEANEYEVIICENNKPLESFNKIVCKYDADIKNDLPLGRVLDPIDKYKHKRVVIGFTNQNGNDINFKDPKITPKRIAKLDDCVNHIEQKIILNIKTSDLTYRGQKGQSRTITNDGYLKQNLEDKVYDVFDLSKTINIKALKSLGFKKAKIQVSGVINIGKAEPCIKVMNHKVKNKKDFKKKFLMGVEKLDSKELKSNNTYIMNETIPISELKNKLYVYYNSDTLMDSDWILSALTVDLEIVK